MIANVIKGVVTRGRVSCGSGCDTYVFELAPLGSFGLHGRRGTPATRWEYKGKHVGDTFISADRQGYEFIPQEFYLALDAAWIADNGFYEFEDPYESLEVQGA